MSFRNKRIRWRRPASGGRFTAVFTGDCCPHQEGIDHVLAGKTDSVVGAVKAFIAGSDLRIMQWETPVSRSPSPIDKCGALLLVPPESVAFLKGLGIDVALLANNHIGDHGPEVVMETLRHLTDAGIAYVGAGKDVEAASAPLTVERAGLGIAILNVAENEFGTAGAGKAGSAPLAPLANIRAIRAAKEHADLVFVAIHGGHEHNPIPSPRMVDTYRAFAEAGADVVFNCHTHCPQGIEVWDGVPIVYSPGNLYFPWSPADSMAASWWTGYLPRFHCDRKGAYAVELMPYEFDKDAIHALSRTREAAFFKYMEEISAVLADGDLLRRYFEAWCAYSGRRHLEIAADRLKSAWPLEPASPENVRKWLIARNLYTCESHCDMMKQFFRLVEEGRLDQANAFMPELARLQEIPWMK